MGSPRRGTKSVLLSGRGGSCSLPTSPARAMAPFLAGPPAAAPEAESGGASGAGNGGEGGTSAESSPLQRLQQQGMGTSGGPAAAGSARLRADTSAESMGALGTQHSKEESSTCGSLGSTTAGPYCRVRWTLLVRVPAVQEDAGPDMQAVAVPGAGAGEVQGGALEGDLELPMQRPAAPALRSPAVQPAQQQSAVQPGQPAPVGPAHMAPQGAGEGIDRGERGARSQTPELQQAEPPPLLPGVQEAVVQDLPPALPTASQKQQAVEARQAQHEKGEALEGPGDRQWLSVQGPVEGHGQQQQQCTDEARGEAVGEAGADPAEGEQLEHLPVLEKELLRTQQQHSASVGEVQHGPPGQEQATAQPTPAAVAPPAPWPPAASLLAPTQQLLASVQQNQQQATTAPLPLLPRQPPTQPGAAPQPQQAAQEQKPAAKPPMLQQQQQQGTARRWPFDKQQPQQQQAQQGAAHRWPLDRGRAFGFAAAPAGGSGGGTSEGSNRSGIEGVGRGTGQAPQLLQPQQQQFGPMARTAQGLPQQPRQQGPWGQAVQQQRRPPGTTPDAATGPADAAAPAPKHGSRRLAARSISFSYKSKKGGGEGGSGGAGAGGGVSTGGPGMDKDKCVVS